MNRLRWLTTWVALAGLAAGMLAGCSRAAAGSNLEIMAPGDPGGGWDNTARALQAVLRKSRIVPGHVGVYNRGGAGGTIGLAEFATDRRGRPNQLMVTGLVMLGATVTNETPVTLADVTPLASLTAEYEALVVQPDSRHRDLGDLITAFRRDPRSVTWAGGSAGGADHMLVGLIAEAAGVRPDQVNYVAYAGSGEATTAVLSGAATVAVSGVSEFEGLVDAGALRYLAVSSPEALPDLPVPTLRQAGVDVELANWRGLVAPPGLAPAQREELTAMISELLDSAAWQETMRVRRWAPFVNVGQSFEVFLSSETRRVAAILRRIGLA